jgi:hypothetical protein
MTRSMQLFGLFVPELCMRMHSDKASARTGVFAEGDAYCVHESAVLARSSLRHLKFRLAA